MAKNKKTEKKMGLVERIKTIENSPDAKEMRERLLLIAKRIKEAPKGADMQDILKDLALTRRVLDKDRKLKALYGLKTKALLEIAEFKRTGKHIVID